MLSDEQMSKGCPFSLLNDEQMSNWLGVEHQFKLVVPPPPKNNKGGIFRVCNGGWKWRGGGCHRPGVGFQSF